MTKKILVVDESSSLRQVMVLVLKKTSYDVVQASDGKEALIKLSQESIDLVITDINMPILSGFEVITEMKHRSNYKLTPIIILTSESSVEMKKKIQEIGIDNWMEKPFDPVQMLNTIDRLMLQTV